MNYARSFWGFCLLFILTATSSRAQFIHESIILRSDYPSKSVLVTNSAEDRIGDISPALIAACWKDSGRQLECRSLLQFNYISLPEMLFMDPSLIQSAQLILYPINTLLSPDDINKPGRFTVKRVTEPWEDSITMWMNQPAVDTFMQVTKELKIKKKNNPVSVDVTKLVMDMLRYGNKGFMIGPEASPEERIASGELFASPKNEDKAIRPLLVINYRRLADPSLALRSADPTNRVMRPQTPTGGTIQQPVRAPAVNQ